MTTSIKRTVQAGGERKSAQILGLLFSAYFKNRIQILLMLIQRVKARDPKTMVRLIIFLEDIEHHFIDPYSERSVYNALRWLTRYLRIYPRVPKEKSFYAIEQVQRICTALGIDLWPIEDEGAIYRCQCGNPNAAEGKPEHAPASA